MIAVELLGLTLAELAVMAAAFAYLADRALSAVGANASTLRVENQDLLRRNGELEQRVRELEQRSRSLQAQVDDLKRHDLASVLDAMTAHEAQAMQRHEGVLEILRGMLTTMQERSVRS